MLNKVFLIGNLTRDVELRYSPNGTAIGKFGIAVNRSWKDRSSGETREETMFIDVSVFGRSAEIANQYLSKGRRVLVEGRLVLEQWVDQTGQKRSRHSIAADNLQFLDSKADAPLKNDPMMGSERNYEEGFDAPAQTPTSYTPASSNGIPSSGRSNSSSDYVINDDNDIPF
ncbi:MAG: single-stranded DNA-binding protein [Campylobacterales bacterium]